MITIADVIAAGVRSLGTDEYWCIYHPDGPLDQSASKSLIEPVRVVCEALKADWDDLQEQGYYIGKITLAALKAREE